MSIKDYLEKQHDIHNKEVSDLQGQIISLRKELFDRTRELEQFAKTDDLKRINQTYTDLDSKLSDFEANLVRLQRINVQDIDKKSTELLRQNNDIRAEFYKELGDIDKKFRDTKLKLVEEQSRQLEQKLNKLNKSIGEVDDLKKELKVIVRQAKTKGVSEESLKRLEPKLEQEKSFFGKIKDSVADFLFEEPLLEEEFYEEKPKKRKEKKGPGIWLWLIPLLIILVLIGLGIFFYRDAIAQGVSGIIAGITSMFTAVPVIPKNETLATPKGPVITVYEGDFVDIVPNMSDADNDKLDYIFTQPLNATGQWRTDIGDAGTYPISVIVSDGEKETMMNFTLVVKAKTE